MADLPKSQLTYFSEKAGVVTKWGPPTLSTVLKGDQAKSFKYSDNGKFLAVVDPTQVAIFNTEPWSEKTVIKEAGITEVYLSPKGSYLVSWQNPDKDQSKENLKIWSVQSGKLIQGWKMRSQLTWPATIQWTPDELIAGALLQVGKISFFTGERFATPVQVLQTAGLAKFSIAPQSSTPCRFAVFVAEKKKDMPGHVAIYSYPQLASPVTRKNFFADSIEFLWNSTGSALLLLATQDEDRTGKSYYGKKGLFLIHSDGSFDQRVTDEAVHDVKWNPNGKEFAVVYGDMPETKTSIFNLKCVKSADLAESGEARNTLLYDASGRILFVGGFGSLSGNIDFWDLSDQHVKKVGRVNAFSTTYHEWCPDGQHVLAAVLSPRLRMDNGIKIYNYHGELVHEEKQEELWQVHWRPAPQGHFPLRPISPMKSRPAQSVGGSVSTASAQTQEPKKYRHPNFTGASVTYTPKPAGPVRYSPSGAPVRNPVGGNPVGGNPVGGNPVGGNPVGGKPVGKPMGGHPPGGVPIGGSGGRGRGAGRGQQKKKPNPSPQSSPQPKKTASSIQAEDGNTATDELSANNSGASTPVQSPQDPEKKKKIVQKKLKEIDVLKARQLKGDTLNEAQLAKINREAELRDQIQANQKPDTANS